MGAPTMPKSHQDNPSMAQYDPNIDPSSSQVFLIHLKDCPSMAPNHWRTTYPHHTMAFKQQPTPHDPARRNAREHVNSPGLWPTGVRDPRLWWLFWLPIGMAIRVCRGAFGLELCPARTWQATSRIIQKWWFRMGFTIRRARLWLANSHLVSCAPRVSLQPARAIAIMACQQCLRFWCSRNNVIWKPLNKKMIYKQKLEVGAPAMCSKRYTVLMFDDQASKWTQVAPKPPKIAPRWPQHGPRWPQVWPK